MGGTTGRNSITRTIQCPIDRSNIWRPLHKKNASSEDGARIPINKKGEQYGGSYRDLIRRFLSQVSEADQPLHFPDADQFPGLAHHNLKHKMKRVFSHNMCNTICRELLPTGVSYPCTHIYAPWTPLPGPRPTQMARPPPVRTASGRGRAHFASLHSPPAAFCCRTGCSSTYTPHRALNDSHWPQTQTACARGGFGGLRWRASGLWWPGCAGAAPSIESWSTLATLKTAPLLHRLIHIDDGAEKKYYVVPALSLIHI